MRMHVLARLQQEIESLYDVALPLAVDDFLVDPQVREQMPGAQLHLPEQLFVRADADEVDVALYVDPDVLAQLAADDPFARLHAGNLESFCIAAEGVSHFVFLAWRLGQRSDVTALELELQAEVDKFCLCTMLSATQAHTPYDARLLWRQLFERYELQPGLGAEEVARYRAASRAAGRIARSMLAGEGRQVRPKLLRAQSRLWCRRPLTDKLRASLRCA